MIKKIENRQKAAFLKIFLNDKPLLKMMKEIEKTEIINTRNKREDILQMFGH